jgi:hypothetical protein
MTERPNFRTKMPFRVASLLAVALLALPGCNLFNRSDRAPMTLRVISGSATIHRDGAEETTESAAKLQVGDRIVLSRRGIAELSLAPGRLFELVDGEARVSGEDRLEVVSGRLLGAISAPARVKAGRLNILATATTFRVDRTLSTRTGVYKGKVNLQLGSERLTLPRLRQAVVAEGVLPGREKPLRLDAQDRWDKRFLQSVLDLDTRLANFGRGLEAQLGPGSGIEFFSRVMPSAGDLSFLTPFSANRRSDLLIGLTLSSQASGNDSAKIGTLFNKAFGLWNEGASWGLVAYEFQVEQVTLFTSLIDAIGRSGLFVGGQGPALLAALRGRSLAASSGGGTRGPGGGPGGTDFGSNGDPGTTPIPPPPPPPPIIVVPPVEPLPPGNPVEQVVEDIVGTLPGGNPEPSSDPGGLLPGGLVPDGTPL